MLLRITRLVLFNLLFVQTIIDRMPRKCLFTPARPARRGGTVVLDFGAQQAAAVDALAGIGVHFDVRQTGMRLSPHIYTSPEEIETVLACLAPFAQAAV